jgi:hypothetical protein
VVHGVRVSTTDVVVVVVVAAVVTSLCSTACSQDDTAEGPKSRRLTTVLFAVDTPVLVTGDHRGFVDVYRLVGLPVPPPTIDEQVDALMKSLHPT